MTFRSLFRARRRLAAARRLQDYRRRRLIEIIPEAAAYSDRFLRQSMRRVAYFDAFVALLWLTASGFLLGFVGTVPWADAILCFLAVAATGLSFGRLWTAGLIAFRSLTASHDWAQALSMVREQGADTFRDAATGFHAGRRSGNEKDARHLVKNLLYQFRSTAIKPPSRGGEDHD